VTTDPLADRLELVAALVGDQAGSWDLAGSIPVPVLRELAEHGLLCPQVPARYGGCAASSLQCGQFTAGVGSLCGSVRSVLTSQGMAAWTIQRLGDASQRQTYLPQLTGGRLAAVAFSERDAGSDLSAISTEIRPAGDSVVLTGDKVWVTAAHYADLVVTVGRYGDAAAAAVVPADAPGVRIDRIAEPLGCRAAGHAMVRFDSVRLPATAVLGGGGQPLALLVTTALAYGRMSVAWGCAGMLRACLSAATEHARTRRQSGRTLAEHQLVARQVAELFVAEQTATRCCEHASRRWDAGKPDLVVATMLAKYVSAGAAARGAATAVQILASAGAADGHAVARAYRDAKLMEIIEGSNEICQLLLAQHALAVAS
jgi:alkylation response protein AidB-like acyl-CoA dehydrogenase